MIHGNYEFGNILVGRITSERATVSTRTTTPPPTNKLCFVIPHPIKVS